MAASRFNRRLGLAIAGTLGLLVATALALSLAASWFASAKIEAVQGRWEREVGGMDSVLERYPRRESNATAQQVERLALRLGIDITPRWLEGRSIPEARTADRFEAVRHDLGLHVTRHVERDKRKLTAPRAATVAWLREHRATLAELRALLVAAPEPYWHRDLSKMISAPIPNLLGHVNLQRALLAEVLVNEANGDRAAAREGLEASWRLNRAIVEDAPLIEQTVGLSVARHQAGVIRQLGDVPSHWTARLDASDYRDRLIEGLQISGWVYAHVSDSMTLDYSVEEPSFVARRLRRAAEPYYAFGAAMANEQHLRRLRKLIASGATCDGPLTDYGIAAELDLPDWAEHAAIFAPGFHGFDRLRQLEFDLELTRMVLEQPAAGRRDSAVCPGDSWSIELAPDGSRLIAFSREAVWPDRIAGADLPSRFLIPAVPIVEATRLH